MTVTEPVTDIQARLAGLTAEEVLADAAARYAGRVAFATQLDPGDQVITHMIATAGLAIPLFTIDTGRLFPEVHDLIEQTCARYGLDITVYCPDALEVERMVARAGVNLFRQSSFLKDGCCETRKVRPLRRAQVGLDVVIGSRHGSRTAAGEAAVAEWDASAGLLAIDPLAGWDATRVWEYVRAHDVPYNPLHDQGFSVIDCAPCSTAAGAASADHDHPRYP